MRSSVWTPLSSMDIGHTISSLQSKLGGVGLNRDVHVYVFCLLGWIWGVVLFLTCWKMLDLWVHVLTHVTGRVYHFRYLCVCPPDSKIKSSVFNSICVLMFMYYTVILPGSFMQSESKSLCYSQTIKILYSVLCRHGEGGKGIGGWGGGVGGGKGTYCLICLTLVRKKHAFLVLQTFFFLFYDLICLPWTQSNGPKVLTLSVLERGTCRCRKRWPDTCCWESHCSQHPRTPEHPTVNKQHWKWIHITYTDNISTPTTSLSSKY